jgi:hypothetical protein
MDISKEWMKKDYLKNFKLDTYWKKEKKETKNKDGKKTHSKRWKNVVCEMETGMTELVEIVSQKTVPYVMEQLHT